jgi:hypothetical protein
MADVVNLNIEPVSVNATIDDNSDTQFTFVIRDAADDPVDLSGYSAIMQLRPYIGSSRVYDELTSDNGRLMLRTSSVDVIFPVAVTLQYTFKEAVYDLILVSPNGRQTRTVQGKITIDKGVTR